MLPVRYNSRIKSWRNKKDLQRITKLKHFVNKYNWEGKKLRKIILQLLSMLCMLKRKKYILLMFQNIIKIVKKKLFF